MFEKYYSEYFLRDALVERGDFHPLPKRDEREAWENLDEEARSYYMENAEKAAVRPVPQILASGYMEYSENGNRTHFEDNFHGRRKNLRDMVIAECCENKGRFFKPILDYTYAICDEFTWVIPAHNNHKGPEKSRNVCRIPCILNLWIYSLPRLHQCSRGFTISSKMNSMKHADLLMRESVMKSEDVS